MRKKFLGQGMLLGSCLLAGTLMLASCGSELDEDIQAQEQTEVASQIVKSGTVSLSFGGGLSTRVSGDAVNGYKWVAGDQLVCVSHGVVCGTLVCTGQTGTAGTFTGTLTEFDPSAVRIYYVGNQTVDSTTMTFDFSQQNGSERSANARTFFYLDDPIQFKEESEDNWVPAAEVPVMKQLTKQVELDFTNYSTSDRYIQSVVMTGLKNQVTYNLLTGEMELGYVKDFQGQDMESITVSPLTLIECNNDYFVSLPSQNAATVTLLVSYLDGNSGSTYKDNYNLTSGWNLEQDNSAYLFSASGSAFLNISDKAGYSGSAVDTGEKTAGQSDKGGYSGSAVDGSKENATCDKSGYGGSPVGD